MMPSPPGRFSTTTGFPHRAASRSANSRAAMSVPLPVAERQDKPNRSLRPSLCENRRRRPREDEQGNQATAHQSGNAKKTSVRMHRGVPFGMSEGPLLLQCLPARPS